MAILRLKDPKYFSKILKAFTGKKQVTFKIAAENMRISSLTPPYIYLSISNELFEITEPSEFTINILDLQNNLNIISSEIIVLQNSFKIVSIPADDLKSLFGISNHEEMNNFILKNHISFIDIPFHNPIEDYYKTHSSFSTRFFIDKSVIKIMLDGIVKYTNGKKLIIQKSNIDEEEIMEVEVEYLEKGYLEFLCSNDWITNVLVCYDLIRNILFCFTDGFLSIKIAFKTYSGVFMELQILERIG